MKRMKWLFFCAIGFAASPLIAGCLPPWVHALHFPKLELLENPRQQTPQAAAEKVFVDTSTNISYLPLSSSALELRSLLRLYIALNPGAKTPRPILLNSSEPKHQPCSQRRGVSGQAR